MTWKKKIRIMIVKMIKNLEGKMEKMQKSINKDLEELINKHTETNNNYWNQKYSRRNQNILSRRMNQWAGR